MVQRARDPERPEMRWVAILRDPHPPVEEMAADLTAALLRVDYVREAQAEASLGSYELGPDSKHRALRGVVVLAPLADLPDDDLDFERIRQALCAQSWVLTGLADGVLPPHPTATIERAVDDHHRMQAAATVRQIVEDSRYDWLSAEQRELAIALNTVWATLRGRVLERAGTAGVSDPERMQLGFTIDSEFARELAERGNLPSWMWDERFWEAAAP